VRERVRARALHKERTHRYIYIYIYDIYRSRGVVVYLKAQQQQKNKTFFYERRESFFFVFGKKHFAAERERRVERDLSLFRERVLSTKGSTQTHKHTHTQRERTFLSRLCWCRSFDSLLFRKRRRRKVIIIMPLYDLILQVKSHVPRHDVFNLLKRTSLKILDADGVLVDVKSFGHQTLAYVYKKPNERHHEVQMSQLTFASAPKVLPEISHALRVDEKVVRWMVLKRKRKMEPLIKYKAWTEEQRAAIESRENNNDSNSNNAGSEGGGGNRGREFGGGGRGGRR